MLGSRRRRRRKALIREIAKERIIRLFELAEDCPERSRRYLQLAKRIGMRYRVRIPPDLKRRMCKGCAVLLIPGRNARVRLHRRRGYITTTCLECGRVMRVPYKPLKKKEG
ncbi:MAG TPA: ribonuclease P [Candidatus Syntrophoarchaeum butanivorans]|uniref:Ribonuclease P protein component 4 n=1 Tax=Candidatus Syntropharchaeum butanivorans TaxID=1839936 RepID=A0A7J2S2I0_9EURY|nr:MAG: ribonuclease P [Candidatus Syntrophoarchaeum sp. WYZ-LMO15]RLG99002.1 MAG: ribonuclease P [Candidatus Bathyarchaeota archaeon]HEC57643.1 ribonuclease P [Candidatus Syntrophoarchaeum butanivorans]